jgi:hypothetical protein
MGFRNTSPSSVGFFLFLLCSAQHSAAVFTTHRIWIMSFTQRTQGTPVGYHVSFSTDIISPETFLSVQQ